MIKVFCQLDMGNGIVYTCTQTVFSHFLNAGVASYIINNLSNL